MKGVAAVTLLAVAALAVLASAQRTSSGAAAPNSPRPSGQTPALASEQRERRSRVGHKRGNKSDLAGKLQHVSEAKSPPPVVAAESQDEPAEERKDEDGIKCTKIDKKSVTSDDVFKGRFKRAVMTCYKCEDLKKGGTYEKCSVGSDPKNQAYFETHQKSYSTKEKPKNFKFDSEKDGSSARSIYDSSPSMEYLLSAASIGKYNYDERDAGTDHVQKYEIPESSFAKSRLPDDYAPKPTEYKYSSTKVEPPQTYSHHEPSSSYNSHKDGKELVPKSTEYSFSSSKKLPTQTYSYESTDPPVSYSYKTDTEYGPDEKPDKYSPKSSEYSYSKSKVEPQRSYSYESTDKPISYTYHNEKSSDSSQPQKYQQPSAENEKYSPKSSEYSYSKTITDPLKTYHESSSYGDEKPKKPTRTEKYSSYESEPAKKAPQVKEYAGSYSEDAPKKSAFVSEPSAELKRALGEFHQKDRTNCEKVKKDLMTCWVCKDQSGAQQEECMYIASAEPKVHAAAYSDVREVTQRPERRRPAEHSETKKQVKRQPAPVTERVHRVAPTAVPYREQAAPTISPYRQAARRDAQVGIETLRAFDEDREVARASQPKQSSQAQPEPDKPKEFEVEGSDGAFSAETREVFDKALGLTLPAYMLQRSRHEELFDETVRSGR